MTKTTLYDPPSGWLYGFPREYRPLPGESLADTLVRDGYPKDDAAWAADHCRFLEVPTEESAKKPSTRWPEGAEL